MNCDTWTPVVCCYMLMIYVGICTVFGNFQNRKKIRIKIGKVSEARWLSVGSDFFFSKTIH